MTTILLLLLLAALTAIFLAEMYHSLRRSSMTSQLIQEYFATHETARIVGKMYAYAERDWKLRKILARYRATEEDFRMLHQKLLLWGDFKKGRRYVPISSFFYAYTLEYLLRHKDGDAKSMAMKCMNFFHI